MKIEINEIITTMKKKLIPEPNNLTELIFETDKDIITFLLTENEINKLKSIL